MRVARWFAVAVAVLFLAGCGQTNARPHPLMLILSGKTYKAEPSTPISLTLESNRSTGYHWALSNSNKKAVALVSHRYVPPKTSRPGAVGHEIWRFTAVAAGMDSHLRLAYTRPSAQGPAQMVEFTILVR